MVSVMSLPRLYTPEEVAEQVGHLSPFTLRRLVAQGVIPCHRVPPRDKIVFSEADVLAILELFSQTTRPQGLERPEEDVFRFSSKSAARHRE